MGNIGAGEIFFIAIFALLVFGPKRLPEIGRSVGKALAEVRKATNELKEGFTSGFEDFDLKDFGFKEIRELKDLTSFRDLKEPLILNGPIKATRVTNQTAPTPPPNHPNQASLTVQASPSNPADPAAPVAASSPHLLGTSSADPASGTSSTDPGAGSPTGAAQDASSPDRPSDISGSGEDGAGTP